MTSSADLLPLDDAPYFGARRVESTDGLLEQLESFARALNSLATGGATDDVLHALSSDETMAGAVLVEAIGRQVDALRIRFASEISSRSQPHLGDKGLAVTYGFRQAGDLIEHATGVSAREARRRIRLGRSVAARESDVGLLLPALFPAVGDALTHGELGVDTAEAIVNELAKAMPRADVEALEAAEQCLVDAARHSAASLETAFGSEVSRVESVEKVPANQHPLSADLVRIQARVWRDALDADGVEPRADEALKHRDLWISRTAHDGLHTIKGRITSDVAARALAVFDACLSPRTAPRFLRDEELAATGTESDHRTPGQQRADVFAAMVESFLGNGDFHTPPAVVITAAGAVDGSMTAATGEITGVSEPVPASAVRQMQCNGGTQVALADKNGGIVSLSTTQRLFSTNQRRAMVARDGHECIAHGCHIPATGCEAHHVTPWHRGGATHVNNGVLLCWWHHRQIDTGRLAVEMHNGVPQVRPPHWVEQRRRQ